MATSAPDGVAPARRRGLPAGGLTGYQAIVAAPGFALGVRCSDDALGAIEFLPPQPEQAPNQVLATETCRQLRAYLDDPQFAFDLPLQALGTAFQRRVWAGIAAIPCGQTQTYGALAHAIQSAPRAVGQACGANHFPLIIPCHRVIASGGGLGGFNRQGGGFLLDIKRWLLAHEGCSPG
jgi:methylated-DNA-[protein]-cysteine S-methyltransferase